MATLLVTIRKRVNVKKNPWKMVGTSVNHGIHSWRVHSLRKNKNIFSVPHNNGPATKLSYPPPENLGSASPSDHGPQPAPPSFTDTGRLPYTVNTSDGDPEEQIAAAPSESRSQATRDYADRRGADEPERPRDECSASPATLDPLVPMCLVVSDGD